MSGNVATLIVQTDMIDEIRRNPAAFGEAVLNAILGTPIRSCPLKPVFMPAAHGSVLEQVATLVSLSSNNDKVVLEIGGNTAEVEGFYVNHYS